jgi:tRNA (adenine57-N1/adenine58-N1)-methyltransferase catalytic subunit
VLEAGVGSGALSMALLRAGAEVVGYEVRADFAARARANVESFLGAGAAERYHVVDKDVYEGIAEDGLDRIVLDLPEPWRVVPHAVEALRPGGLVVSYLPTVGQVSQLREAVAEAPFVQAETIEVLVRSWHVEGRSVRPDHRMVGHTGFLTSARFTPLSR